MRQKVKKMSLGVFQGRLSPPRGRGIQFFPFETWREEFPAAENLELSEIEFIFDKERYEENPLWTNDGIKEIKRLRRSHGIAVNHICADYFMRDPFFRVAEEIKSRSISVLKRLVEATAEIGARNIEIPLVDNSSIKTEDEERALIDAIGSVLPEAKKAGVTIGLETDLPPKKFRQLLERFGNPTVRANYDTGNSASLGFSAREELLTIGPYIRNIHIKDRVLHGGTVPLSRGNADFEAFFSTLKEIGYEGSLILQAARGEDGREQETIEGYIKFIHDYIGKYLTV